MVDAEVVRRARGGDREAFDLVILAVIDRLFAIARLSLRDMDAAEDAVQEALVRCWRDLPSLRDPNRFESWMYRLLMHAVVDQSRRSRRYQAKVRLLPTEPSEPDASTEVADREVLEHAFRRLSVNQRTMVVLHHYVGLTVQDAAAALSIPVGTAKSRLFYGMEALRSVIDEDAASEGKVTA